MRIFNKSLVLFTAIALAFALGGCKPKKDDNKLAFGGGPTGGTFGHFANAMSILLSKKLKLDIASEGTGGSAANLKMIDRGNLNFGIVYAGDAFLGRSGKLPKDTNKYTNLRLVSFLYGAPAQLVVLKDSGINSPLDLKGKKVAVGNAGSGAALAAERYFKAIGLWDNMNREFLGYSAAASALKDGQIDAFWVLVGFPNSSIIEAGTAKDIKLLDLVDAGDKAGFFKEYPFYSKVEIPAKTYKGQTAPVKTFQDSALWAAHNGVKADIVYRSLQTVFSTEGLKHMLAAHKAAKAMTVENGLNGMATPLHPGAQKFWAEKGLQIPDMIKAQ